MTAPTGVYARRNAGHRAAFDARLQATGDGPDRLAVAFDYFRAACRVLAKRRPPRGISQDVHRDAAAGLLAGEAGRLIALARQIDRGDFDAKPPGKG